MLEVFGFLRLAVLIHEESEIEQHLRVGRRQLACPAQHRFRDVRFATVLRRPLRVRALVRVRCPRTGKPRR